MYPPNGLEPTKLAVPSTPLNVNPVIMGLSKVFFNQVVLPFGVSAELGKSLFGMLKNSLWVTSVTLSSALGS